MSSGAAVSEYSGLSWAFGHFWTCLAGFFLTLAVYSLNLLSWNVMLTRQPTCSSHADAQDEFSEIAFITHTAARVDFAKVAGTLSSGVVPPVGLQSKRTWHERERTENEKERKRHSLSAWLLSPLASERLHRRHWILRETWRGEDRCLPTTVDFVPHKSWVVLDRGEAFLTEVF